MEKVQQLNAFLTAGNDLIQSKYILADIKIANLLKTIAQSETLMALFKNCLTDFDYQSAKKKYIVKSPYLSNDKYDFVLPDNSKDLLAFIFNVLMELDSKEVEISDFLDKYFYEDGSYSSGYLAFMNGMIRPFCNSVKVLMESVIEGKIQDPVEALTQAEKQRALEREIEEKQAQKNQELSKKIYGENILAIKKILVDDKTKIKESKKKDAIKQDVGLIIDMLANALDSEDKDAIIYAYTAYKYCMKAYNLFFLGRAKKVGKLLKGVLDAI